MKGLELAIAFALLGLTPDANAAVPNGKQCGGLLWSGETTCVSGSTCVKVNHLFSECKPVKSSSSTKPSSTSPAISRPTPTSVKWAAAIAKAKNAVKKLSNEDKAALASGTYWAQGPCVGNTLPIPSIKFPGYCLQDAPLGVRFADKVSVFPAWDRELIRQRGIALGEEFRGKGVHIALGPAMNMARAAAAGRNWEGFGGDPYLSGESAYETIVGMQSKGVQACAKHYINNEQETHRDTSSSNVDDRTEHEIYAHTFLRSVQAGVTSFMCSYNQVNNTYACENDRVLNQILKSEFGFQGFILSDWWAKIAGPTAANKGLDMVMPGDTGWETHIPFFGTKLVEAVANGEVPQARLDDMAVRILSGWYYQGQDSGYPAVNFNSWNVTLSQGVDVQGNHKEIIRKVGAASHVLLKNVGRILPLKKPKSIAVIGTDGGPPSSGNPNVQAKKDGSAVTSSLNDTDLTAAKAAAAGKSVALVFINADSGEGYLTVDGNAGDRNDLKAWHNGDALVAAVADANPNTVVVVHSVGQIIMEPWIEHPNIKAVVWAGLQGQEAGNSLVDVLYGKVNPSGKLAYTIAKKDSDYPAHVSNDLNIPYTEGLFIDYRHFDKNNIAPRYEFGFGLSYTTFEYSKLNIIGPFIKGGSAPTGPGSSLSSWLHDDWVTVTFQLKNTGDVTGAEVAQLYISPPASANSPPSQLREFSKVELRPKQSQTITLKLSRYSFSIWDTTKQKWVIPSGKHGIWVGSSSRAKKLAGSITL
ncbi:hypothetical protein FRC03_012069 [Tulasnella sp. 419]|nr:hypothetical protein FRC03_012069 [Tulasnella sp. 419]